MSEYESERHTWRPDSEHRPVVQPFMPPVDKPEIREASQPTKPARPGNHDRDSSSAASDDDAHLADYVRVLWKRRWTAASTFVIVVGSAVIYTFTATPIYEARVRLLIETENPNVLSFQEVIEQNKTTNDYYQTQYRILESRALAERTLGDAKLWSHPEFAQAKTPSAAA